MSKSSADSVQLSFRRAAPDQRLTLTLALRWLVFLWLELFFVLPTRLFLEFVVFRWFSPVVHHVGRPILAHFFIKLAQYNVTRSVPAQIRILVNSTRSYALAHITPTFLQAGRGWAKKVEVNGTQGWWLGNPDQKDRSKDDIVVYFIHGGAFLFDAGANSHEFFMSVMQELKYKHDLNASMFALSYRLPPEFSYPSQLIEALAGYHYLVNTLGIDESKIVVAGDSAGGNLAEALLLHLARPTDEVSLPQELGPTPKQPGGALLISPYHNLYSASHSLKANGTFDLLDSTLAARAAFSYIGAADQLPESYKFKMPSLNPLFLLTSPQRNLPHPAEHLPGVFGFSDIKGIEYLKSPYVNPAVQRDRKWWKEAMPAGGRTMVTWGGVEVLADDCAELYRQLEEAGVEPAKLYKELGIHDWLLHDWFLPFSWRTKTKGPEGHFFYGRDRVVDLLHTVASTAAKPTPTQKTSDSSEVSARGKTSARAQTDDDPAPAKQQSVRSRGPATKTTPAAPGPESYAHVAGDDSHVASSAPIVAEGEQAKIVSTEEQRVRAERDLEAYEQAPTTRGPTFARVAADSEHLDPDAPVVAAGERVSIDRGRVNDHHGGPNGTQTVGPEPGQAQTDSEPSSSPAVSTDGTEKAGGAQGDLAAETAHAPEAEQDSTEVPKPTQAKPKKKKKAKSPAPAPVPNGQNGGVSYAAIAAHDDHVAPDAPVVAEGEGAVIDRS